MAQAIMEHEHLQLAGFELAEGLRIETAGYVHVSPVSPAPGGIRFKTFGHFMYRKGFSCYAGCSSFSSISIINNGPSNCSVTSTPLLSDHAPPTYLCLESYYCTATYWRLQLTDRHNLLAQNLSIACNLLASVIHDPAAAV